MKTFWRKQEKQVLKHFLMNNFGDKSDHAHVSNYWSSDVGFGEAGTREYWH